MRTLYSGWSKDLCLPELCKHPFSSQNPRTDLSLASQCFFVRLHSLVFRQKPTGMPMVISGSPPLKSCFFSSRMKSQQRCNLICHSQLSYIVILCLGSTALQGGPENDPGGKKVQSRLTACFSNLSHHVPSSGA